MGSIEKRGTNRWRLTVVTGYEENGDMIRERRTVEAKNKTEAKKQLAVFESEILGGTYQRPDKLTLRQYYDTWHTEFAQKTYSPKTLYNYELMIEGHILPKYGRMTLQEIKPIHVVSYVNELQKPRTDDTGKDTTLSAHTVLNHYKAFHSLLSVAHKWQLIASDPSKHAKPKQPPKKKAAFEHGGSILEQLTQAIEHEPEDKQLLFWIAFVTSARQGEIAALEAKHIDTTEHTITFEQSLTDVKGQGVTVKSIKNHLTGTAAIPEGLTRKLQKKIQHNKKTRLQMGDAWTTERSFVFADIYGKPIRPDSISQWWRRFIKKYELPAVRFHDLRHMSITFLIGRNLPMKSISERARHANIHTTMDVYGHQVVEVDRVSADQFNEFFTTNEGEK